MFRSYPFITVAIFSFLCYSPFIGGTFSEENKMKLPRIDSILSAVSLNNDSAVGKHSDNVLDFLDKIKLSVNAIESQIYNQTWMYYGRLANEKLQRGASENDFHFSASIVKESAAKVRALADELRKKIELIEAEKNLRSFAAKLVARENRTSLDNWLDSKSNEVSEAILHLTMHFSELSNFYQSHLSNLEVLKRRVAVVESYDLPKYSFEVPKNDSKKEVAVVESYDLQKYSFEVPKNDSKKEICHNGKFVCENGLNIFCSFYCDGESDCDDESDEPPSC